MPPAGRRLRSIRRWLSLWLPFLGSTIWVWVTIAASRPSLRVMLVCSTMVVRPECSGVQTARTLSPFGIGAKKLVLLSIVAVRWLGDSEADAVIPPMMSAQRHDRAAVHDVAAVAQLLPVDQLGLAAVGTAGDDVHAHELDEGRSIPCFHVDPRCGLNRSC